MLITSANHVRFSSSGQPKDKTTTDEAFPPGNTLLRQLEAAQTPRSSSLPNSLPKKDQFDRRTPGVPGGITKEGTPKLHELMEQIKKEDAARQSGG